MTEKIIITKDIIRQNQIRKPIVFLETGFNIIYLFIIISAGALLYISSVIGSEQWLFGLMALILGVGDSFHLTSRIRALWDCSGKDHTIALGVGKQIASITMTVFYVILWHIGMIHYPEVNIATYMTWIVYSLAILRIILSLFPNNQWIPNDSSLMWAVLRNIPFFILGMLVMILFAVGSFAEGGVLSFLWIAVLISFACYIPVVLFSGRNNKAGMLMILKSCAYIAIVLMGFSL